METFEAQGEWHTPDNPERKVGGVLRVRDDDITLTTIGSLSSDELWPRAENSPTRIVGKADGKGYTLDDCYLRTARTNLGVDTTTEEYFANRLMRGAWFEEGEIVSCRVLFARMKHFAEWFGRSGISRSHTYQKSPQRIEYDVSLKQQRATICRWNETVLRIRHWVSTAVDSDSHTIREDRVAELKFKELTPIEDAIAQMSNLQDLVTIATERPAEFTSVSFGHPDVRRKSGKPRSYDPINFIARWNVRDQSTRRSPRQLEMLFTFDSIGGRPGVSAWMEVAERHRSELGRVIAARFRDGMMVEDRFFNCAAALQALDQTATGHTTSLYRTRLRRLAGKAGNPFEVLVGNVDTWIDRFKDARDDHAHHYKRGFLSTDLLFLGRSAYWIFVLCLLRDAAVPDPVFDNIVKHRTFQWEGERIRAVLGT